jgi:hypothetical protein
MNTLLLPVTYNHNLDAQALDSVSTAAAYEHLEHAPLHPEVVVSYDAFKEELMREWVHLNSFINIQFYVNPDEANYTNSKEMLKDLDNSHLKVFATDRSQQFHSSHPMLEITFYKGEEYIWNDIFRAVHDVYGHYRVRSGFGLQGELDAWLAHRQMFPVEALTALWCETRGQAAWTNCWNNHSTMPLKDRPFASQKSGIINLQYV